MFKTFVSLLCGHSSYIQYIYILVYIHFHTYILHTFIMVTFDTGTNFPAVSWNSLLAVAMMKIRLL
jgi:hypothetical protein